MRSAQPTVCRIPALRFNLMLTVALAASWAPVSAAPRTGTRPQPRRHLETESVSADVATPERASTLLSDTGASTVGFQNRAGCNARHLRAAFRQNHRLEYPVAQDDLHH